jgi:hypothetical protein
MAFLSGVHFSFHTVHSVQTTLKVDCIQSTCTIDGNIKVDLGGDPCPGTPKKLTLQVECDGPATNPTVVPWHISAVRIVNQVKPVNYTGVFKSSDPILEQSWYSGAYGTVRVFRQKFTLEDAIGSHAYSLEANIRVINGIPLGCSLVLPVDTVNCVQTLKAADST